MLVHSSVCRMTTGNCFLYRSLRRIIRGPLPVASSEVDGDKLATTQSSLLFNLSSAPESLFAPLTIYPILATVHRQIVP